MWVQNTTQSNHSINVSGSFVFETIPELLTDYAGFFQATSLAFDLIASLLATIFIYRFYKHIEINHPLYAVIFMDIVISTATSYLSSILFLVNSIINSNIIIFVEYGITSISVFNNISSFMMIAFIRYYLLVRTKTSENEEEIDMMKVKNVSLIMNCVVFIIILLIRGGLYMLRFIGYNVKVAVIASGFTLIILPLVTALILNRKIDNFLKTEHDQNNLNVNNSSTLPKTVKYPRSHKQSLEDSKGSNAKREIRNPIILDLESSSSPKIEKIKTSKKHSRYAWACKTEASTSASHYNNKVSQRYGGIYIGPENINPPNATNVNENEVKILTNDVNMLPNQLIVKKENKVHVI